MYKDNENFNFGSYMLIGMALFLFMLCLMSLAINR